LVIIFSASDFRNGRILPYLKQKVNGSNEAVAVVIDFGSQ